MQEPDRLLGAQRSGWRGPGWRVFDAQPGQVGAVRGWISVVVAAHGCRVDPADAALVVSELFTNAVVHGPRPGRVLAGYCLWPGGVRIVVCDEGGAATPRLRDPGGLAEGGRGLRVIDAIAARWGSFRTVSHQVVWCDLGQPLQALGADALAWLTCLLAAGPAASPEVRAAAVSAGQAGTRVPDRAAPDIAFPIPARASMRPATRRRPSAAPPATRVRMPGRGPPER